MGGKFIPNGDLDFALMAESFARNIAAEPGRFAVVPADADALSAAVARFRETLDACRTGPVRSTVATRAKDEARRRAERIVRRIANLVRANENVDVEARASLNLRERSARPRQSACPQEPPRLRFVRALHEGNGATPVHELEFAEFHSLSGRKPDGAVRLELFVDLIPPDEPIPAHPAANYGGRPWYLRSFTRSPMKIAPPLARVPMRVVYWGRWADSAGNVGPFSATAVAWIEGGSHHLLAPAIGDNKPVRVFEDATTSPALLREAKYRVALLEVQYQSLSGALTEANIAQPSLPAPEQREREPRQLEGPPASEAA